MPWQQGRHRWNENKDSIQRIYQIGNASNQGEELPEFDFSNYVVKKNGQITLDQNFDLEYTMNLNTEMDNSKMVYTINGKTFTDTENIVVKEGYTVKVKSVNNSESDDHPMHLHGQFLQVLSKNGKPIEGSPFIKDTINLKSCEDYEISFNADNP